MLHLADISQFESLSNQSFVSVNNGIAGDLWAEARARVPATLSSLKPPMSDPSNAVSNVTHTIYDGFNSALAHMQSFMSSLSPAEKALLVSGMTLAAFLVNKFVAAKISKSKQQDDLDSVIERLQDYGFPEEDNGLVLDVDDFGFGEDDDRAKTTLGSVPVDEQVNGPADRPVGEDVVSG